MLGFGVWGLGFGVWGLGFGVWGLHLPTQVLVPVDDAVGNFVVSVGKEGRDDDGVCGAAASGLQCLQRPAQVLRSVAVGAVYHHQRLRHVESGAERRLVRRLPQAKGHAAAERKREKCFVAGGSVGARGGQGQAAAGCGVQQEAEEEGGEVQGHRRLIAGADGAELAK